MMMSEFKSTVLMSFGCALLAVGCTVIAPDSRIEDVSSMSPKRWAASEASQAGVDTQWVDRFKDRELSKLVDIAISSTPNIRAARERVVQARQDARMVAASLKPSLTFGGQAERSQTNFPGFFDGSTSFDSFTPSLRVNWEPDVWGDKRAAASASIGEFQAQSAEFKGTQALLAAEVCRAWFSLAEAREQEQLAKDILKLLKDTEATVSLRFEQDLAAEGGSASQLRLSQTDIATAKSVIATRSGEVEALRRQLEILVGRYPNAKLTGRKKMPIIGNSPPVGLPSELLMRRPDIIAAERRYAAAGKLVEQGKYAIYPRFPLTASIGTSTSQLKNILNSAAGVWSLGLGVDAPIYLGGEAKAERNKRSSQEIQAIANLQHTALTAFGEVESALASERWIVKRIASYKEALKLADDAVTAAEDDYANGTGDGLTILSAKRRRIDTVSQIALLRRMRAHIRVDLHLALGGEYKVVTK